MTPITDHLAQGLARLLEQYKDKPRVVAFIGIWLDEVQRLEDAIQELLTKRHPDNATGDLLDKLAAIVGISRNGASDDALRVLIRGQVLRNRSSGQWADLHAIAGTLLGAYTVERWRKAAAFRCVSSTRPEVEQGLLEGAAAAGVRIDVIYSTEPDEADRFVYGGTGGGFGGALAGRVASS